MCVRGVELLVDADTNGALLLAKEETLATTATKRAEIAPRLLPSVERWRVGQQGDSETRTDDGEDRRHDLVRVGPASDDEGNRKLGDLTDRFDLFLRLLVIL